jgi:hypothetical protein
MNADMMIAIHGLVGIDEDGYLLYVSNITEQPYIRATAPDNPRFLNLHADFDNTS